MKLTIVAPVFNEEKVIGEFYSRLKEVLDNMENVDSDILFVVDKSTDQSLEVLRGLALEDEKVRVLALSSRFGHQLSLFAGIENSLDSDAIIMMDSDLQHPPSLIPDLVNEYQNGYDVVSTIRKDTKNISLVRKLLGNLFYYILKCLSDIPVNSNAADFRLISARVAHQLIKRFPERKIFLRVLINWIGFKQTSIEYKANERFAGESKYTLSRAINLAATGVLSFSTKPLQLGIFLGVTFAVIAFLFLFGSTIAYFMDNTIPSGWTTIVTLMLLFSGVQLIILGIIGVYIGNIYEEIKSRPHYIVEEIIENGKK
jgi:polyisoprenyl-phosphate glycosyltransferase